MSSPRYDAIVIGAGMSGLAAGIRLAQFDKRVIVLEKHALTGGLNSYYKLGGRRLDTGLHALTNFARKGERGTPLGKLLRQLRIAWDELALAEQSHSEIVFPGARLAFSNDFALLESEVARAFPNETGAFARLSRAIDEHDPFDPTSNPRSARDVVRAHIGDPLLVEMLLEPVLYYGSATERDIDWDAFVILFRSIFKEGLARPEGGVKRILDVLARRLRECGGELAMRCGVARVLIDGDGARGVALEDGRELVADHVFSSAGLAETLALCGREFGRELVGRLSFVETITVMEKRHAELGHTATMTFFNTRERFDYRRPDGLIDAASGVICCSDNYRSSEPMREGIQRVTVLADHDRWSALPEAEYAAAKARVRSEIQAAAERFVPSPLPHALLSDAFTPRTIRHYTGHFAGAVYGSPKKRRDGSSGIANLHIIGTDQGLVGIVGAMLSGITMANRHALVARA